MWCLNTGLSHFSGSGTALPVRSHSLAQLDIWWPREPCISYLKHSGGWSKLFLHEGVTKVIAYWSLHMGWDCPFMCFSGNCLQSLSMFFDALPLRLSFKGFTLLAARHTIGSPTVHSYPVPLKSWYITVCVKYTFFCIQVPTMARQWPQSLTKAIHYLPSMKVEKASMFAKLSAPYWEIFSPLSSIFCFFYEVMVKCNRIPIGLIKEKNLQ